MVFDDGFFNRSHLNVLLKQSLKNFIIRVPDSLLELYTRDRVTKILQQIKKNCIYVIVLAFFFFFLITQIQSKLLV